MEPVIEERQLLCVTFFLQYFTILLVILVGMVVTSALGYVYRTDVKSAVHDGITDGLNKYGNDTTYTNEIDFMQKNVGGNNQLIYRPVDINSHA